MTDWRPQRTLEERMGRAVQSMQPGTMQGRVGSARPIPDSVDDVVGDMLGADAGGSDQEITPWVDYFTVRHLGEQTLHLTYQPMDKSEHFYWHPEGGAAVYQAQPLAWARDKWTVTAPDPTGIFEIGDVITVQYLTDDLTPRVSETITFDIPGIVYAFNHAGDPDGGFVTLGDDNGVLMSEDGDTSYLHTDFTGANSSTGYGIFVKFLPTQIPGDLISTSLVIQSKGNDSRTASHDHQASLGYPDTSGPYVQIDRRDYALAGTGPDYGWQDMAYWGTPGQAVRTEGIDYIEDVTPLKWTSGERSDFSTFQDVSTTDEYVTKDMIQSGHVEANPGGGMTLQDTFVQSIAYPAVDAAIRYSYVALRITYAT